MKNFFFIIFIFIVGSLNAQFFQEISNPRLNIKLSHPPLLGLKISKVIFNPIQTDCSDQVVDEIIGDFINNGVEVIDRANLDLILAEHKLSLSGYIDKTSAASIGEIVGPSALVTLKILRCETIVKDNLTDIVKVKDKDSGLIYDRTQFVSRTEFILKASIQVTDLTTGRIFQTQTFDYNPKLENRSFEGRIEAPSEYKVQELAFNSLVFDIHKLFFYWNEQVSLIYFNDKKCGMDEAFEFLKNGDLKGAYLKSQQNVEFCSSSEEKDKYKAHAYYNLAMSYFVNNEYDLALSMLAECKKIKDFDIADDAIAMCNKAKNLSLMSTKFEEKASLEMEQKNEVTQQKASSILKNEDVIALVQSKLPESLIIQKIKTSDCKFDTTTQGLLSLIDKGVSEAIIAVMMEK